MVNKPKRRGTAWESEIVRYLQSEGVPAAERRALAGQGDRGDIAGIPGVVIEAKACRAIDLAGFLAEAEAERANDGADLGVVWIKRRMRASAADGYAVMDGRTLVALLRRAGYLP